MKKALLLLVLLLGALLWAEEEHLLTTGLSLSVPVGVDQVFSSVPRVGTAGMLDLGYRYLGRNQSHTLRLLMGGGLLFPMYIDGRANTPYFGASFDEDPTEFTIGLRLDLRSTFQFFENDLIRARVGGYVLGASEFSIPGFLNYAWVGEASLGLAGEVLFTFNDKHSVELMLAMPVAGLLSRPYWLGYIAEDEFNLEDNGLASVVFGRATPVSFDQYIRLELSAVYAYRLNNRVSLAVRYDFLYRRITVPRESQLFGHLATFNVYVHFPGAQK